MNLLLWIAKSLVSLPMHKNVLLMLKCVIAVTILIPISSWFLCLVFPDLHGREYNLGDLSLDDKYYVPLDTSDQARIQKFYINVCKPLPRVQGCPRECLQTDIDRLLKCLPIFSLVLWDWFFFFVTPTKGWRSSAGLNDRIVNFLSSLPLQLYNMILPSR